MIAVVLFLFVFVWLGLEYAFKCVRFTHLSRADGTKKIPPWYPYVFPLIGHAIPLVTNPLEFYKGIKAPVRLRIPTADPFLIQGYDNIRKFFKTTPSSNPALVQRFVGGDLFGMPKKASMTFLQDMSGRGKIPRPGTNMEPRNRVCHLDHDIIQSMLQGDEATEILQRLVTNVYKRYESLNIGHEWLEKADLFEFLTMEMSPAVIETFFGPLLTEVADPQFVRNFWEFDNWVAAIAKKIPRWIYPKGFEARDKLVAGLMRWRSMTAAMAKNGQETGASRGIMRKLDLLQADDWDMEAIAATDLGFIASFSSNPIPTLYWLNHEIFRSPALLSEIREECRACFVPDQGALRFDISPLRSQPLLQSSIAEALRLRTHVYVMRYPDEQDLMVNQLHIPKGSLVMACSTTSHMDPTLWNTGPQATRPLSRFWAERFLDSPRHARTAAAKTTEKAADRKFSSRGLDGIWLPFGGGTQMCPGQLFSKTFISLATALLVTMFDIELSHPERDVPVNWSHFGAGVIRPGAKAPFRIRRREKALL